MTFDELKKLHQKKYRDEYGFFLAEGEHLVLELGKALAHRPELAAARIFVSHEYAEAGFPPSFPRQLDMETLNARQISQLSDTRSPQGVIAVVPILPVVAPTQGERAVYLHEIQDPGNLGTILRTLAWFGGFRCLLSPASVDPYNPKVVRASMGGIFTVPVEVDIPADSLTHRYARTALLDTRGKAISHPTFKEFDCYMFGNEARGASADLFSMAGEAVFSIPGGYAAQSLNVATAVNLSVYELYRP
jgi:RNA methyltransferase, TrmH family